MTAPTPRQFEQALAQSLARINKRIATLPELYAVAYNASHERVVRESGGKISRSGVSDPTGDITGDPRDPQRPGLQRSIRAALERAPSKLADAENTIGAIETEITRALDRLDPREGFTPTRYPISVTHADLDESRAAQVRRNGRGEGIA